MWPLPGRILLIGRVSAASARQLLLKRPHYPVVASPERKPLGLRFIDCEHNGMFGWDVR